MCQCFVLKAIGAEQCLPAAYLAERPNFRFSYHNCADRRSQPLRIRFRDAAAVRFVVFWIKRHPEMKKSGCIKEWGKTGR